MVKTKGKRTYPPMKGRAKRIKSQRRSVMDQLLTVPQVSEQTGIPVPTLYDWVKLKKVNHVRIGKKIRFTESQMRALIDVRVVKAPA